MSKFCIIGDLHGRTKTFQKILRDSESKGSYHYIFIGDLLHHKAYFKRTKKSSPIKLLTYIKELTDKGKATVIRGNNEQYILDNMDTPLKLIKSSQVRYTVECLRRLSMTECDSLVNWLRSFPFSLEVENFRIAHAYYPKESTDPHTILTGPGYPWFKRDPLSDHLSPEFIYLLGHYGYPFIKQNLKIIDATLFEGVGVYYTDLDEFMVYY